MPSSRLPLLLTILPPWGKPTVPIGLGYLSQQLTEAHIEHEVADLNLEIYGAVDDELKELWRPQAGEAWADEARFAALLERLTPQVEQAVERLAVVDAELVGFSVNQSNALLSTEVARQLRTRCPERTIVFGGLGVYVYGERRRIPPEVVDLFVMGEGEATLLEIARRVQRGQDLSGIAGTVSAPKQKTFEPRAPLDLSRQRWPTYDRFMVKRYPGGGAPLPIALGRGCVCRCSFCGDYPFWGRYRSRSGRSVVDEMEHHLHHYGIRVFEFNDLAINGDLRALEALADRILQRRLDVAWSSYAYIRELPNGLANKLRRAGCTTLRFGMESASDPVLERMRKPHRAARAARLFDQLAAAGIRVNIGLMVGFPDETDAELEQTAAFLRENQGNIDEVDSLSVFYIKPLSEVEQHPERFGVRFPQGPTQWKQWEGRDGSTLTQRTERARVLIKVIERTSIKFQRCNIFGF